MAKSVIHVVNFGSSQCGLSTVGYTLYNVDGTINTARSTAGVVEIGTSTGIYSVNIPIDENENVIVLWDTGGVSPRYASEEYRNQINKIQDETDHIRLIWNSLRNHGDFFSAIMDKLNKGIELSPVIDAIAKSEQALMKKDTISLDDIKRAITIPEMPEQKDYTTDIASILNKIDNLKKEIDKSPKHKDSIRVDLKNVIEELAAIKADLVKPTEIIGFNDLIRKIESVSERINAYEQASKMNLEKYSQSINKEFEKINSLLAKLPEDSKVIESAIKNYESTIKKQIIDMKNNALYVANEVKMIKNTFNDLGKMTNAVLGKLDGLTENDKSDRAVKKMIKTDIEKITRLLMNLTTAKNLSEMDSMLLSFGHRRK